MNNCVFLGRLTRDPELKYIPSGTAVVNFSLAINRRFKKSDGSSENEVAYIDCEAWDSGAETLNEHFQKGDPILIEASLKQDRWETENGEKRSKLKFRVNRFHFMPNGQKTDEDQDEPQDTPVGAGATDSKSNDDDIPF